MRILLKLLKHTLFIHKDIFLKTRFNYLAIQNGLDNKPAFYLFNCVECGTTLAIKIKEKKNVS